MVDMRKIWKAQLNLCEKIAEDIIKNNASEEVCKYADKFAVIESPYETGGGCCGEDNIRINFGEAYCHINIDENGKPTGEIWWSNEEMGIDAAITYEDSVNALNKMSIEEAYEKCEYIDSYINQEGKEKTDYIYKPFETITSNTIHPVQKPIFARDLCRAKRLDNGEWVEGNLIRSFDAEDGWKAIIIPTTDSDMFTGPGAKQDLGFENWYRVDPDTVCHCLGMTDNNKQLIFEKDIVEFVSSSKESEKYLLWWSKEGCCMAAVRMDKIWFNGQDYGDNQQMPYETFCVMIQDPYGDFKDIKVTDNIIDNPDIVKGIGLLGHE